MTHDDVTRRIETLSAHRNGWCGADSLGPTETTISDALAFAGLFDWAQTEKPFIGLATDGEINFLWKNSHIDVDLGFFGDGTYSYYVRFSDGREIVRDDVPVSESLPRVVLDCLLQLQECH